MKNKYKSLFVDSLAFMSSNFASKLLVFLLIPLYTSILSTNEYGVADLITNTINLIYPILTFCIAEATLRYACEKNTDKKKVLGNSILIVILAEIIVLFLELVYYIITKQFNSNLVWFDIIFFCFNFHECLSQYSKGIGKTKLYAVSGVIHTLVIIITNIIGLLVLNWGLFAYLFSIALGYFITSLFLIIFARIKITINYDKNLIKDMLKYSAPLIPTTLAWWVSVSADKYIIILYYGIALSGIYSIAYKVPSVLTLFTNIFSSAWTISVMKNVDDKDNDKYQSNTYLYFNAFIVIICSLLIIMSKFIGKLLFAKDFFVAWKYVPWLLVAYLFAGLSGFLASSFRAAKKTNYLLISSLIGSIVNIILNIIFIKRYGIMSAAITTMVGFAVVYYIRLVLIRRIVNLEVNIKKDSFVYILLVVQALIISFEIEKGLLLSCIIFGIIVCFFIKDLLLLLNKITMIFSSKMKGHKNDK